MARVPGRVQVSSNYEVKVKAPFDARMICPTKADLTDANSWSYVSTYVGMLVSVQNDPIEDNNGVYFLKVDEPFVENSWVKLFSTEEFSSFQEQLEQDLTNYVTQEQISGYAKIAIGELPEVGDSQTIYFRLLDGNWEEYIYYNNDFVMIGSNAGDLSNYYTKSEVDDLIAEVRAQIPTSLAQLSNDATGFITAAVDNLVNYYTKAETYTQEEVNALIGQIATISFEVVDQLPQTGESNKIYLVAKTTGQPQDGYDEYIYVNGNWEHIGSTDIDLSQYATNASVDAKLEGYVSNESLSATLTNYAQTSAIPTLLSQLTNDTGFITLSDVQELLGNYVTSSQLETSLSGKQDTLVSGTNIKTINGQSILGSGDIQIQGGGGGDISIATEDTVGGILATDNSAVEGVEAFVDVDDTGKASVKIPSVDETSTPEDVVNLLNTSTLILNGNA